MSSPPAVPDRGNLRASDTDRERVAEILRQAAGDGRLTLEELDERLDAVYAAKTYAELEPITNDLPDSGASHVPAPAPPADPARFGGQPGSATAVAIMGGFERKGDWVVPKEFNCVAFMGGGELDMREARFEEQTVKINIVAIMGGVEITVPDDANVRVQGIGIMGGFDHSSNGGGQPGGPTIVVTGVALMGGVEIKRKRPRRDKLAKVASKVDEKLARIERRRRELGL
ncbi:MAG TPA: DUF1707 domain-containing protein [Trebonia sp.]|jgi:hypothetical protein|nr:DUF1707 domain-containing protein [Trebonia sp.]